MCHDGNAPLLGFGHIRFSVPELATAVRWFDQTNLPYVYSPDQGKMRDGVFIKDPDGYWIEIVKTDLLKNSPFDIS